jgi:hypothetical protein
MNRACIVQVGLTADSGLHYAAAAHAMRRYAYLVDAPPHLDAVGPEVTGGYERVIAVAQPTDSAALIGGLTPFRERVSAIVPGCDPCANAVHEAVIALGIGVQSVSGPVVPGKALQRKRVRRFAPQVHQPQFAFSREFARCCAVAQACRIRFPVIAKPVGGSGGVGVCLVASMTGLARVAAVMEGMRDR